MSSVRNVQDRSYLAARGAYAGSQRHPFSVQQFVRTCSKPSSSSTTIILQLHGMLKTVLGSAFRPTVNTTFRLCGLHTSSSSASNTIFRRSGLLFGSVKGFEAAPKSKLFNQNFFSSSFRRSFVSDTSAVIARPSQSEAWKRYGITAVRSSEDILQNRYLSQLFPFGLLNRRLSLVLLLELKRSSTGISEMHYHLLRNRTSTTVSCTLAVD